jgi:hypothetical protein
MRHPQVLAVTESGTPFQFLHWQDAITQKVKGNISYEMGDLDQFLGGTSRMTGERSHVEIGSIVFIKGKFKYSTKAPALTNTSLFKRDLYTCSYCGRFTPEAQMTRDHIVPVSKGGKDTWTNCTSACKKCNNAKGNHMLEDTEMELIWVPYTPNRAETLILSNRNILADQAQFISHHIPKHSRVPQYLERHCGITL